ncbi:cytochrome P460 family protein [Rhizobium sp. S152]|uniref:cytochrome P460 family protein n=1 Tax=Rhizobium sp. S152 TaxID=3055038 RepID=UPI0025A9A65F|nr:cytochrome P460 family protein [Rhizobium sp. S152]MDM9625071.1 cytochrome P460 family protein [Rhizobium sp. S152]
MTRARSRLSVLAAMACGIVMVGWQVDAEPTKATMPDISKLVHYTTVTRGEVTEHIMTTREAIEAVKAGKPVPNGTHFALVDYRDGKVFRYFIMEKGAGWGADYDETRRTGDWQFQWFKPDGTINTAENTARCQSCHSSRADREFLYTFNDIRRFEFD